MTQNKILPIVRSFLYYPSTVSSKDKDFLDVLDKSHYTFVKSALEMIISDQRCFFNLKERDLSEMGGVIRAMLYKIPLQHVVEFLYVKNEKSKWYDMFFNIGFPMLTSVHKKRLFSHHISHLRGDVCKKIAEVNDSNDHRLIASCILNEHEKVEMFCHDINVKSQEYTSLVSIFYSPHIIDMKTRVILEKIMPKNVSEMSNENLAKACFRKQHFAISQNAMNLSEKEISDNDFELFIADESRWKVIDNTIQNLLANGFGVIKSRVDAYEAFKQKVALTQSLGAVNAPNRRSKRM